MRWRMSLNAGAGIGLADVLDVGVAEGVVAGIGLSGPQLART